MTHGVARETRLFALTALLVGGYGVGVTAVAIANGQLELLKL